MKAPRYGDAMEGCWDVLFVSFKRFILDVACNVRWISLTGYGPPNIVMV